MNCCKPLLSFRNTTVVVELENVNDNTPSFTQQKFFFTETEVSFTYCVFFFSSKSLHERLTREFVSVCLFSFLDIRACMRVTAKLLVK